MRRLSRPNLSFLPHGKKFTFQRVAIGFAFALGITGFWFTSVQLPPLVEQNAQLTAAVLTVTAMALVAVLGWKVARWAYDRDKNETGKSAIGGYLLVAILVVVVIGVWYSYQQRLFDPYLVVGAKALAWVLVGLVAFGTHQLNMGKRLWPERPRKEYVDGTVSDWSSEQEYEAPDLDDPHHDPVPRRPQETIVSGGRPSVSTTQPSWSTQQAAGPETPHRDPWAPQEEHHSAHAGV